MTRTTLLIPATLTAAALLLSACSSDSENTPGPAATVSSTASPTDSATDAAAASGQEHAEADVMFAQMMIPHHQQAIEMSDIILSKDAIPAEVTALAEQIKAAQGPEIQQLTDWLEEWGEPTAPEDASGGNGEHGGHGGHDMSMMEGMLSPEELEQLSGAEGVAAARLFLEQMIAHHEGAVTMAEDEVSDGRYQPAVELAQTIIDTQQKEIDDMRRMLESL